MPADAAAAPHAAAVSGGDAGNLPTARRRGRPRPPVDPWRPLAVLVEEERDGAGGSRRWLTVLLAGAECPYGCVFCDLWRHTLDGPTPAGALPAQLAAALAWADGHPPAAAATGVKLYNASNLFEPRAVPPADDAAIAALVAPRFERVAVECHPRLVGERCFAFARRLAERGSRLEVAMGLETVHPRALPRLGKAMTVDDFDRAAAALAAAGCALRAFVLVGAPNQPPAAAAGWAARTAAHAFAAGAGHASLIPVRGDTPEMRALAAAGAWAPPALADLEAALDLTLAAAPAGRVATADLWDLERLAGCDACFTARRQRLERINLSGTAEPRVACEECTRADR